MTPKPPKPPAYSRPTLDSQFHIDLKWWERSEHDLRVAMQQICEEFDEAMPTLDDPDEQVDWIDPVSAEVHTISRYAYAFLTHCATKPDYITERTSLVEAVFRTLLATGNRPMTPHELAERIGRTPANILAAVSGRTVYRGISLYTED